MTPTIPASDRALWRAAALQTWKESEDSRGAPWVRLIEDPSPPVHTPAEPARDPDVFGVTRRRLPIVVELAGFDSSDTPGQLLVRATVRGARLRQAWTHRFRHEWGEAVGAESWALPEKLTMCQLVCAGSAGYWDRWISGRPMSRQDAHRWTVLSELKRMLPKSGFDILFVRLDHSCGEPQSLPVCAVEQKFPELGSESTAAA